MRHADSLVVLRIIFPAFAVAVWAGDLSAVAASSGVILAYRIAAVETVVVRRLLAIGALDVSSFRFQWHLCTFAQVGFHLTVRHGTFLARPIPPPSG